LGLVTGTLALSLINDYAITDYRVWGLGLVSLAALSAFVWFESQKASAMIGLDIFKNRQFRTSIGAMLLMFIALSGILILIPFYLEQVRHFQPKQVGLYLIILPILMFILAPLSGRLSDRIGYRLLTSLGVGMLIAGLLLLTNLDVDTSNVQIITYLVVVGAGVGVFNTPNSSALMGSVREDQRSVTSSILATTRNIGMSIGVALSTALFAYFQINYAGGGTAGEIFIMSYKNVIYVSAAVAAGSLVLCLTRAGSHVRADK
jgi:predicted MFS family arabinose efflux permease